MPRAKRGEIWMADLGLAAKVRPVLVLSVAYEGQERAIVSYVIHTTSLRDTQYEVRHETRGMPNGAFDAQGLGSIPEIKLERRVGHWVPGWPEFACWTASMQKGSGWC
jgi:mRNA interferase MazF